MNWTENMSFLSHMLSCTLSSHSRSEVGILTSTALLNRIIRQVTSEALLQETIYFLLGEGTGPETLAGITQHPLRHRLIEHCDHLSDEVTLAALTVLIDAFHPPLTRWSKGFVMISWRESQILTSTKYLFMH